MNILFSSTAYQKYRTFINSCEYEISGLGRCTILGTTIYVDDIILLPQEVTGATTDIDDDAQAKFLYEETKAGTLKEINLWWHSHVDFKCFWSGTDTATIKRSSNSPYMVSIVGNKAGDALGRLDIFGDINCTIDITDINYEEISDDIKSFCEQEIKNKVTKKTWIPKKWEFTKQEKEEEAEKEEELDNEDYQNSEKMKEYWKNEWEKDLQKMEKEESDNGELYRKKRSRKRY